MNEYHWENEARSNGMEIEIDDDRSISELIDSIREVLQQIGKERSMTVMEMSDKIKYPIDENEDLIEVLKRAPMISFNGDRLQFKPLIGADSEGELKISLETHPHGVKMTDVETSSTRGLEYAEKLVHSGEIIGTRVTNGDSLFSIFPRFCRYIVDVSGTATVTKNSCKVVMTENVENEVRQGDALIIEGSVYRVDRSPLKMPFSVNSLRSDTKTDKGEYDSNDECMGENLIHRIRQWNHRVSHEIYLQMPYHGETKSGVKVQRFGVSNDIRRLWLNNLDDSIYSNDRELEEEVKRLKGSAE